jgi:hypothetical protein
VYVFVMKDQCFRKLIFHIFVNISVVNIRFSSSTSPIINGLSDHNVQFDHDPTTDVLLEPIIFAANTR